MRLLVAAFRDTLGAGHPTTLAAVDNLAVALDELGRLGEAAALKREAVAGFRAAVGPAHPDTLIAAHNLALALLEQGRRLRQGQGQAGLEAAAGAEAEARALLQQALDGLTAALGADHATVAVVERTLAQCGTARDRGGLLA